MVWLGGFFCFKEQIKPKKYFEGKKKIKIQLLEKTCLSPKFV